MINLILTGSEGKMGKAISKLITNFQDIKLIASIDVANKNELSKKIDSASVVIDFTVADSSIENLSVALSAKKPIVIGATGQNPEQKKKIISASKTIPIVYSPNMSIGVNTMWRLIEIAAKTLGKDYQIDIAETHHIHKKDAPSGTAKKILEVVAKSGGYDTSKDVFYHLDREEDPTPQRNFPINVTSIREGEVVGDHTIIFTNPYERLEITHHAFSREVFASGAIRAALWIVDKKPGLYDMSDVLF